MTRFKNSDFQRQHDALIKSIAARLSERGPDAPLVSEIELAVSLLNDVHPRGVAQRIWVVVYPDGAMIDCSAGAAAEFGLSRPGDRPDGLGDRLARAQGDTELVTLIDLSGCDRIMVATRMPDQQSWQLEETRTPILKGFHRTIAGLWQLTPAETDIAEALLQGKAPDEIAAESSRAIGTVRQIIKALMAKMQVHSQAQTVARLSVVAVALAQQSTTTTELPRRCRQFYQDATNSPLVYWRYGEAQGEPVLFFHGALFGIIGRANTATEARMFGLDVIAPERPGYGDTKLPPGADPVALAITRACAILDFERIERVQIIAHDVGSVFAFAFARAYPDRVSRIICAPATPPMMGWAQTADMPPLHRVSAFAAQKAPAMMEMLIGLGLKRIEREGLRAIPQLIFADCEHDRTVMLSPEAYPIMEALYLSAVEQRATGFLQDMLLTNLNWSSWLGDIRCPVVLMHGTKSRTVSENALRVTCAALSDATLTIIPDAGHTLPITHPTHTLRQALQQRSSSG
ncbi:alpha/beta fold hydrolase [Roseinatronobacter alkalisoli]|uniref:Alpha/beta fold hydrolase n=1 Tax=Roseinatronobacter alkalisoli TaxID=3028235 RepID=A0ABT5TFU4_9RHOB|nr:alpha/beta fold hydrolase [Roseinatronobacter sp. HJB301]MDD7973022.1 alpha/beta fold hydrolase [Roseinatronobacter sp. HJB301]